MTDRETIIDLLQDVQAKGFWSYGTDMYTGEEGGHVMTPDLIADYLMENGVTIPVRCKDCIHWYEREGVCLKIYSDGAVSPYAWQDRNPDDFCSYGERDNNA